METRKKEEVIRVLGIETSCDETAISLVRVTKNLSLYGVRVVKHLVTSQIPIHQRYGGVVPEIAARSHVPETVSLISQIFSRKTWSKNVPFDVIAVTRGPGLPTALGVGVEAGRALALLSGKPIVGVNHLEAHIASAWLNPVHRRHWKFPLLALVVSGGHTELVLMRDYGVYERIGQTRDDAAGEAFDKTAKLMGLPYPGGPQIAERAKQGNPSAFAFPRPMLKDATLDFSFSGLKTSVRQTWERITPPLGGFALRLSPKGESDSVLNNVAASVQQAIVDVLVEKTMRAVAQHTVHGVVLVGGVSANEELRRQLGERLAVAHIPFLPSDRRYITDNAAMVAAAGAWQWMRGVSDDWRTLDISPDLDL